MRRDVLQVVDGLRQVFDGVDVVMRRRRDQSLARRRVSYARDERRDLVSRKLTAFARLRALGNLDLDLVRRREIRSGHSETAGRNLLDAIPSG